MLSLGVIAFPPFMALGKRQLGHIGQENQGWHPVLCSKCNIWWRSPHFWKNLLSWRCMNHVNEARTVPVLFCRKGRVIERLLPSCGALVQHIKRAAYQAGHVWSLQKKAELQSPLEWAWKLSEDRHEPLWSLFPEVSKVSQKLIKCSCKRQCTSIRYKCLQSNLPKIGNISHLPPLSPFGYFNQ